MRSVIRSGACVVGAMLVGTADGGAQHQDARDAAGALVSELEAVRRATAEYRDVARARADGYVQFLRHDGPLMGEHWVRRDLVDQPFDLTRPSTLQYVNIGGERRLIGVAYTIYQRPGQPMPAGFTGSDDVWHVHDIAKFFDAVTEGRPVLRRLGERRMRRTGAPPANGRTQLVMLHAWVWLDNPDGVFALHHRALPYLRAGLPVRSAEHGSHDAASGVALLQDGACRRELRSTAFLARLHRQQRRALRARCDAAADAVRAARASDNAHALDAVAAREWRSYLTLRDSLLTPVQKSRLASVAEHGGPLATGHVH